MRKDNIRELKSEVMWKRVLRAGTGSLLAVLMFGMMNITAMAESGSRHTTPSGNTSRPADYISEDRAKEIALDHAGLSGDQITFLHTELKRDDHCWQYEVEFYYPSGYAEYDYDIDACTGTILSYDYDAEYYDQSGSGSGIDADSYIGVEKAKSLALERAGLTAEQVSFKKSHLDWDDGIAEYQVEFYYGDYEYEIELDAIKGTILDYEREYRWD